MKEFKIEMSSTSSLLRMAFSGYRGARVFVPANKKLSVEKSGVSSTTKWRWYTHMA